MILTVEVFHGGDFSVTEVSEVNGSESAVANFPLRIKVVGGGVQFVVGENWREKTRGAVVVEEDGGWIFLRR